MIKGRTVFILGAGASADLGMPVGSDLASTIRKKASYEIDSTGELKRSNGDLELFNALLRQPMPIVARELYDAALRLAKGISYAASIDDYLDTHRDDVAIVHFGKAAIVRAILEAEQSSKLFSESVGARYQKLNQSWYPAFMRLATRGTQPHFPEAMLQKLTFIVFNYDRCLEHFLVGAIQDHFSVPFQRAAQVVRQCEIIHPYGDVGNVIPNESGGIAAPFGKLSRSVDERADRIRTYTEKVSDHAMLTQIQNALREAETLIFLGFAFHTQNMRLLETHNTVGTKRVFATARGFSEAGCGEIRMRLYSMFPGNIAFSNSTNIFIRRELECREMIDEYAPLLAS